MNAGQLYPGEYYAYHPYPPKGRIPIDAIKVRLRHVEQRKNVYDKNRHTLAAITFVETGKESMVRARELIMFWDEYEVEQAHMLEERAQRERARRKRELRGQVIAALINYRLNEKGVPLTIVVDWSESTAQVNVQSLFDWLEISESNISEAVERIIEKEDEEAA